MGRGGACSDAQPRRPAPGGRQQGQAPPTQARYPTQSNAQARDSDEPRRHHHAAAPSTHPCGGTAAAATTAPCGAAKMLAERNWLT